MSNIPKGYKKTKVGVIPEEWEVVRFGEIFERVTRKNTIGNTNVLTISAQHGLINQEDFFNKSIASKDLSGYILLKKGEFAYNKSYSKGYPMGAFKRLNLYDEGVLSNLYIYFKIKDDNSNFYEHYFEAGLMNKEIYKIAQEGARNHGLLNMSVKEFFNEIKIIRPPLKEQQIIAQILTTWDKAISKQKELIKAKEKLKKGLMQRLLSAEVRFREFSDEWEEVKLWDVGRIIGGGTPKTTNVEYWGNEILWFTPTEIKNKYIFDSKRKISKLGLKKSSARLLPKNTLLLTTRATIGDIGISQKECTTNQGFQSIIVNDKNYYEYLYYWLLKNKKELLKRANGSTFIEISKKDIEKIPFKKPPLQEQQKIAEVLSMADKEIELLKKELEELKKQKKGLMQRLLTADVRVKV